MAKSGRSLDSGSMLTVSAAAALGLLGLGLRRSGLLAVGTGLAAAAALLPRRTNRENEREIAAQRSRPDGKSSEIIELALGTDVNAPREDVTAFWSDPRNYPAFFHNVRALVRVGERRWRWTLGEEDGPSLEWEVEMTEPGEGLLTWKSVGVSAVETTAVLRFEERAERLTRVDARMTFVVPTGAVAETFARLMAGSPERVMSRNLARASAMIERKAAAGGAHATPAEV